MEKQGLPFDSRALDSRLQGLQALPTLQDHYCVACSKE